MISARKAKQLDATTMFTYSHANTALGQSERAYYLSYFINTNTTPSSGEGWLDRVSSTVFIALGLGGRSVSFGDRNASLGEFRSEGN